MHVSRCGKGRPRGKEGLSIRAAAMRAMKWPAWMLVAVAIVGGRDGRADTLGEATVHSRRAIAAYALRHCAEAASEFEAAFKLEPDKALLFDAAQAHRCAGNGPRALELYQSYLGVFPTAPNRGFVEQQIARLQASGVSPAAQPASGANAIAALPSVEAPHAWQQKPWVWGAIGGAVIVVGVALGVGLGVGLHGSPSDPVPSLGAVNY
jgi:hypothetical protein